jgi:hypothetical protein
MGLFEEITNCSDCPKVEALNDENTQSIKQHLKDTHRGASTNAYMIAVANRCDYIKNWIQQTYESAKQFLDDDFAKNFLVDFEQRCWELSVYQYLVDCGISINIPAQREGPDFETSVGYIECIAVKRGDGANAIPLLEASILRADGTWIEGSGFQPVPTNEAQLRISTAITTKTGKYEGYTTKQWFDHSMPRLIAVNWWADGSSFGVGSSSDVTTDPMLRTLFGTGSLQLRIDSQTHEVIDQQPVRQLTIPNANGTEIEVHYFAKEEENANRQIDGIISSAKSPFIYYGDEFRVINNPFGKAIDMVVFTKGHKTITELTNNGFNVSSD